MNTKANELSVKVSVPAKIMLVGEYAVMEGHHSLSLALDKNLDVLVQPTTNDYSTIYSSLWDNPFSFKYKSDLKNFDNILTQAVAKGLELNSGEKFFDLYISSDFCVSSGYGSSSALRLAVLTALRGFYTQEIVPQDQQWGLATEAFHLQKNYQGKASGYDTLTQQVGGVVSFKNPEKKWPGFWENLDFNYECLKKNLHIFIGGKGAPTKDCLIKTSAWLDQKGVKDCFYNSSEDLYYTLTDFFGFKSKVSLPDLISKVAKHRHLMSPSPNFPIDLAQNLQNIEGLDTRWSYKTTGSGGEDALLFFGTEEDLKPVFDLMSNASWIKETWQVQNQGNSMQWIN